MRTQSPPARTYPEPDPDDGFKARALFMLREIAECGMDFVRDLHAEATRPEPQHQPQPEPDATPDAATTPAPRFARPDLLLAFHRASHCVRQAIALEHRIRTLRPADRFVVHTDPRRHLIRGPLLTQINQTEPDPATRHQIRRALDACIDENLAAQPEATPLAIFQIVCDAFDLYPDVAQLDDELLGMPPRRFDRDQPFDPDPIRDD